MSSRRRARSVLVGLAVVGLTLANWLPAPLPARTVSNRVPATVARQEHVMLHHPSKAGVGAAGVSGAKRTARANAPRGVACAPINFTAIGLTWRQQGPHEVTARIRVGPHKGKFGAAAEVDSSPEEGPDLSAPEHHSARRSTELLWVGKGRCARFVFDIPKGAHVSDVRAVFLNTSGTASASSQPSSAATAGSHFGASSAEGMTARPTIVRRSQWGANERLRNCSPRYAPAVKIAFVHHTAGSNAYTASQSDDIVRSIYWYHTRTNGWCDIGYNFLVDRYGQLFEGRYGGMTRAVVPAATMGFNTGSTAISAIGNFQNAAPPSAMVSAITRFLAWKLDIAHVSPTGSVYMTSSGSTGGKYPAGRVVRFNTISSHRDAGYTACPGNNLYPKVPSIRTAAYSLGLPKIFAPRQSRSSFTHVTQSVKWTAKGSSTLMWKLTVANARGAVVRSWTQVGTSFSRSWFGTGKDGKPVPSGIYTVKLSATKDTKAARSAGFRLVVRAA